MNLRIMRLLLSPDCCAEVEAGNELGAWGAAKTGSGASTRKRLVRVWMLRILSLKRKTGSYKNKIKTQNLRVLILVSQIYRSFLASLWVADLFALSARVHVVITETEDRKLQKKIKTQNLRVLILVSQIDRSILASLWLPDPSVMSARVHVVVSILWGRQIRHVLRTFAQSILPV